MKFSVMVNGLVLVLAGTLCLSLSVIGCICIFIEGPQHWYDRFAAASWYALSGIVATMMLYPAGVGAQAEDARKDAERKAKEAAHAH